MCGKFAASNKRKSHFLSQSYLGWIAFILSARTKVEKALSGKGPQRVDANEAILQNGFT